MAGANNQNIDDVWRRDILPAETKQALDFLSLEKWLASGGWYLAGGTALALYAGHRRSLDLDFFTPQKNFSARDFLRNINEKKWRIDTAEDGTVYGALFDAKVSFISYPFFVRKKEFGLYNNSIRVLAPEDIAIMKIIAISQRGTKRDFVDLYWYANNKEPLLGVLKRLPEQYPSVAHDYHHILKSMLYFNDADNEPMPELFFDARWEDVKSYFMTEVPKITKNIIGID